MPSINPLKAHTICAHDYQTIAEMQNPRVQLLGSIALTIIVVRIPGAAVLTNPRVYRVFDDTDCQNTIGSPQ